MQFFWFYPARFPYSTVPTNVDVCAAYHRACINRFSKTSDWLRSSLFFSESPGHRILWLYVLYLCSICWLAYTVLLCSARATVCHPSDSSCPPPPWNGNPWNKSRIPSMSHCQIRGRWDVRQTETAQPVKARTHCAGEDGVGRQSGLRAGGTQRSGPSCWNNELSHLRRRRGTRRGSGWVGEDSCF